MLNFKKVLEENSDFKMEERFCTVGAQQDVGIGRECTRELKAFGNILILKLGDRHMGIP